MQTVFADRNGASRRLKRRAGSPAVVGPKRSRKSFPPIIRFLDEKYIASGSFGKIYRATAVLPSRLKLPIAIKKLPMDETNCTNAAREAEILRLLDHPNIVAIHEIIVHRRESELWMIMEYLDGGSLRPYCTGDRWMSYDDKLGVSRDCWSALSYLHDRDGITHKDLKPENILLRSRPDRSLVAKLCDFGLATVAGADSLTRTQPTAVAGTAMYFPPEYVEAVRNPAKADVYSLGASLCELFGRSYFWCLQGTTVPLTYPQIIGKLLTVWKYVKRGSEPPPKSHSPMCLERLECSEDVRALLTTTVAFHRQHRPSADFVKKEFSRLILVEGSSSKTVECSVKVSPRIDRNPFGDQRKQ